MGSGILRKTNVSLHSSSLHLQVQIKTLQCKVKALYQQHPEMLPASLGSSSSEMDWHKVEKCAVVWRVHISNCFWKSWMSCHPGQRGNRPSRLLSAQSSKANICDGMGVVSARGMGNLHICEGDVNAERYIQVLEQHMLPSKQRLFQGRHGFFQQDSVEPHSTCVTTAWLHSKRVWVLDWPACSPDLSSVENVWRIMKRKIRQASDCWATEVVYPSRMGNISTYNTSAIIVLSSRMLIEWRKRKADVTQW